MTFRHAALPRRTFLAALAALGALAAAPVPAAELGPDDPLAEYQWVARPIVVFANSDRDPRFLRQIAEIEKVREELEARDAVVITDTEPGPSRFDTTELRKKFRPHDFNVILVGKDGEVKKRSPRIVSGAQLVRTIDRLPLRQQEIGRR